MTKNIILNQRDISNKIRRIAFQIFESNADEENVVLAGIAHNGFELAKKIAKELLEISNLNVLLCEVEINKKNVFEPISTSISAGDYRGKSLILIDDVLHTGTTLMYAVKHFLDVPLKQFKTVVLVDRNHKKYPIKVDFKGISLSTTLMNHVEVVLTNEVEEVYLS